MRSLALLLLLASLAPSLAHADGAIFGGAVCSSGDAVDVQWTFLEDSPYGHPEWVGYDVFRRAIDPCGTFVRLNADIVPRGVGNHSRNFTDTPPASGVAYEYKVVPVDAGRNALSFYGVLGDFFMSCPDGSAAIAHGTVEDIGWALLLHPCPESCGDFYIENPPAELLPYATTGEAVRIFGDAGCGSVEGCALQVDHFEPAACVPVPTQSTTWGQIKARYH